MSEHEQGNPWFSIWVRPRQTIRSIVEKNPNHRIWYIAAIAGFSFLFDFFRSIALGVHIASWFVFVLSVVLAPIVGYVLLSIASAVMFWTGKCLKGQGTYSEVRCAIVWPYVLNIVYVISQIILFIMFGSGYFQGYYDNSYVSSIVTFWVLVIFCVQLVIGIWAFVLTLFTLSEVRQYSVGKAIVNMILTALVYIVATFLILAFVSSWRSHLGSIL